jgi:histidine kinase
MNFLRQLRWRIIAAQMLVVVVGVCTLIIVADVLTIQSIDPALRPNFQQALVSALIVAALAATMAGLAASLMLAREILRPLHQLGEGSRRIASGRYAERIEIPQSDELAAVAHSFNQMAEALEQIEQQRVAMIGNVAHELRTPLSGLEGYLEGLIDGVLPNDSESFSAMQHEVRRLRRLVEDLQTLSRVEAGQVSLRPERFDLCALAQRIVTQLQPQAMGQGLSISAEAPPTPIEAFADPDRAAQILINLVGNAIRYTPEPGSIRVTVERTATAVQITVHDTGVGIPPEALPYVFERFYRVDPSRSRASGGSGIGLTIARHLAWAMGGEIIPSSRGRGKGSSFSLTLPPA